jgi:phage-related protein
MELQPRDVVWLRGEVRSPPFSREARLEAGALLRRLQNYERVGMPHLRTMTSIGARCHELRIQDHPNSWRIILRLDPEAVVVLDVFRKQSEKTPESVVQNCRRRLALYDAARKGR